MLKQETINQEDAVEQYFCKPFDVAKRYPLTEENSAFLLELLFKSPAYSIPDKEKPFLVQVIEKRLQYSFSFKINDARLILFIAIITRTPGTAIMYLVYLQYWCKKNERKEIDLKLFCESIFPWGFPNESDLSKIWDKQKIQREKDYKGSDNLLDYQSAMKSIQF